MKIGILGATGAVGLQMIKCIEERKIDCDLSLFASERSEGKKVKVNICGIVKEITIEKAIPQSFDGIDYVLGAVDAEFARKFAPSIVESGAIFIDNSNAFRMDKDVPLVVPEINAEDAKSNKGIISNPNCSTIITDMAIYGINKVSKIKAIIASTYQAVSGAGVSGMKALDEQIDYLSKHKDVPNHKICNIYSDNFESQAFKNQIAYNLIPCIGSFTKNEYTTLLCMDRQQVCCSKLHHIPQKCLDKSKRSDKTS